MPDYKLLSEEQRLVYRLLYHTLRIRMVEEKIAEIYHEKQMRCPTHLCVGQEAVPAGVCSALNRTDQVMSTHRAHGHYLAKGGSLKRMIAEIYGKETGCCGGVGGSQHLIDLSVNFLGSTPIVGGTIPMATGAAWASKLKNNSNITAAFFGDGATEEGVWHESLNFAKLHNLPIIYVCENNLYSVYTPIRERQPDRKISGIAAAHGLTVIEGDGNDVYEVYQKTQTAIESIRAGKGPVFMEFSTYRWREHCGPNFDNDLGYRSEKEYEDWKKRDPLLKAIELALRINTINEIEIDQLRKSVSLEIENAVSFAQKSRFPEKIPAVTSGSKTNTYTLRRTAALKTSDAIREATEQCMAKDNSVIIIGEGVPDPKGIFGTTLGLRKKFGPERVFDMPVSENALTGVCIGAATRGLRPILTHQRLDFSLLSLDQIINNAAKWHYMFGELASVPLVIKMVIGMGWGQGPQHSQSLHALFAHIPGLKVVMPATPYDAKGLLVASINDNNPVLYLEHRWVHGLTGEVPEEMYEVPIGMANVLKKGNDITIVSSSYFTIESIRAAQQLENFGVNAEVIDLRTIRPLDEDTILDSVRKTGRVLVVDGSFETGGITGEIIARIAMKSSASLLRPPARLTCPDYPAPTSPALSINYYPTYKEITAKAMELLGKENISLKNLLREEAVKNILPHDVPDPSFTGPF